MESINKTEITNMTNRDIYVYDKDMNIVKFCKPLVGDLIINSNTVIKKDKIITAYSSFDSKEHDYYIYENEHNIPTCFCDVFIEGHKTWDFPNKRENHYFIVDYDIAESLKRDDLLILTKGESVNGKIIFTGFRKIN